MRDKEHTKSKKYDLEAEKLLGREFEVRKKGLGGEKTQKYRERSSKMRSESRGSYLQTLISLDRVRGVERCRALKT